MKNIILYYESSVREIGGSIEGVFGIEGKFDPSLTLGFDTLDTALIILRHSSPSLSELNVIGKNYGGTRQENLFNSCKKAAEKYSLQDSLRWIRRNTYPFNETEYPCVILECMCPEIEAEKKWIESKRGKELIKNLLQEIVWDIK